MADVAPSTTGVKPLKVWPAHHAYDYLEAESAMAMEFETARRGGGIEWVRGRIPSDALLSRLRGKLLTDAATGKVPCDVIVWIDHDIVWAPGLLAELAKHCHEEQAIIGAPFPYRARHMRGKGFPLRIQPGKPIELRLGEDKLHEVEFMSGGFLAFPVPVLAATFKALEEHKDTDLRMRKCALSDAPTDWFYDFCRPVAVRYGDGRTEKEGLWNYMSDDWVAIWRCVQATGCKCLCWSKPQLQHIGKYAFTVEDAVATTMGDAVKALRLLSPADRDAALAAALAASGEG